MVVLSPAPATLGLSSPALGPWFRHASEAPPTLPLPTGDLSVELTLQPDMAWLTPAAATRSYTVATTARPVALRHLRAADGTTAFSDGSLVVLLTLLPEAEVRLWALTQPIPSPDGTAAPAPGAPARPRMRHLALEVAATSVETVETVEKLRPSDFPADLAGDERAAHVGLSDSGGLSNADRPTTELLVPGSYRDIALENRTGAPLPVKLWAFDQRGRPVDPGALASWWAFLASADAWENLWEDGEAQTIPEPSEGELALPTAPVTIGRTAHLTNAHEGPVDPALLARLDLSALTAVTNASALFTVGDAPAITMTPAPDPDDAPLPRIATLPLGDYAHPSEASPFAGWTDTTFPAALARDFTRLGVVDVEQHVVGLTRDDPRQSDERRRISPARNTASAPVLLDTDAVTERVMTALAAGASATVMAPVMDELWGHTPAPEDFGSEALPDTLAYEVLPLAGEGTTSSGGSSADQIVLVHFESGSLPANGWVRIWPHGLDTTTGLRFRQHGGAGRVDASGQAYVVLPIPDGTAAPSDPDADPVRLSFDALVLADGQTRYFAQERYERPRTVSGARVSLPAPPDGPAGVTLWIAEQGEAMTRGGGQYASGQSVVAVPDANGDHRLVDLTTLDPTDMAAHTLPNAVQSGDTLIVTVPAFAQTPDGDLTSAPNGATLVKRDRAGLDEVTTMGRPAPSQERRELLALERTTSTGVVGATPGRAAHHEAPPRQLGHPGVPAAAEIHGPGIALAGPAADHLVPLIEERTAQNLYEFLGSAGTPPDPAADPGGTSTWAATLETTTFGTVGDGAVRGFLEAATFMPGQSWVDTKQQIENEFSIDIDAHIDTSTFDDDVLAAAVDRVMVKTRDGAKHFADALLAGIGRAEDFLYIETPAIDPHAADGGAIDVIGTITQRLSERPGLRVILCVPEEFLPEQTAKVDEVRKTGVSAALKALQAGAEDRVVLFSSVAGPGRPTYLATTTVVVDDALLLCGSTHLWRRGLTFDSALSVGLFDENVTFGRPTAVRAARLQLMADALGLPLGLLPEDPEDCLQAIRQLASTGGQGRINPQAYPPADDPTSPADRGIWNPDGRPGSANTSWSSVFASLTGDAATEFNSAIR